MKMPRALPHVLPRRMLPWLAVTLLVVIALCVTPSLLRHDTVVQIRVSHSGAPLPDGFYLYQQLTAQGIRIKSITPAGDSLVIHFDNEEQSIAAQKVLRRLLPNGFVVAQQDQALRQLPPSYSTSLS